MKPCEPNPCLNSGVCLEVGEDFICRCPIDYIGSICETGRLTKEPRRKKTVFLYMRKQRRRTASR